MTDSTNIQRLLKDLSNNVDHVTTALEPLTSQSFTTTLNKSPLLDKAKICIHMAYAIEALLFSYLKLSNVDAKAHPIFKELSRVKAYFEKIKSVENKGPQPKLNTDAANRFIKHALSGNEEYDKQRLEMKKKQETGSKRKFDELSERYGKHSRFNIISNKMEETVDNKTEEIISNKMEEIEGDNNIKPTTKDENSLQSSSQDDQIKTIKKKKRKNEDDKKERKSKDKSVSKIKQKSSIAPKDAHQAYQKLLQKAVSDTITDVPLVKKKKQKLSNDA